MQTKLINPFTHIDPPQNSRREKRITRLPHLRTLNLGQGRDNVFRMSKDGNYAAGKTFATAMYKVSLAGDVTAKSYTTSCSRDLKERFQEIEVLEKLKNVPVYQYTYKNEKVKTGTHFSPVAEDWYAAFGFGVSDKTISPNDLAGVALQAVKELAARVVFLEEKLKNYLQ